jgi:hypothetical protein
MLGSTFRAADLAVYRAAVADLVAEIPARGRTVPAAVGALLADRLGKPEFSTVLYRARADASSLIDRIVTELHDRVGRPGRPDPATVARVALLAQIDAAWWGTATAYATNEELTESTDLVHIGRFGAVVAYRRQPATLLSRAARAVQRRVRPARTPHTAGLLCCRVRPELARFAREMTSAYEAAKPVGSPPVWVTSLTRSVAHQRRLRQLGYPASLPSAHCVGFAMDVEMSWLRRFGADSTLRAVLRERERAGDANVIDEGQTWHVCLSPDAVRLASTWLP